MLRLADLAEHYRDCDRHADVEDYRVDGVHHAG
jgi:hypothetical protein